MNTLALKAIWNMIRGKVKQEAAWLFQNEGEFIKGKQRELTGRIQWRASQSQPQGRRTDHFQN